MSESPFDGWAIVELMGHRRLGGKTSVVEFGGSQFLRVDIPGPDGAIVATQVYGAAAIYCLTPTTEEAAKAVARTNQSAPVQRWELPAPAPATDHGDSIDAWDFEDDGEVET